MLIKGKVIKGRGVGQKLDIPTANIELDKNCLMPKSGVYSGKIIIDNQTYQAAIFIGRRLTFNLAEMIIEAAIIDFSGDLYGKKVELEIGKKLRNVIKFESTKELREQILDDIELVKSS